MQITGDGAQKNFGIRNTDCWYPWYLTINNHLETAVDDRRVYPGRQPAGLQ